MLKKLFFILSLFCCSAAYAHILHVGDKTFQLDTVKRTSPALGVGIDDGTFYGVLYSGTALGQTLHVRRGDEVYWLGQNCPAGKYSETGVSECTDCTIGHYCPGGAFHTACTYGAISCKTKNNTTDQAMPAGAPTNKFMTLDEVNEFIPVTDFSDWRQVSCCDNDVATEDSCDVMANKVSLACATGTLEAGTYLFTTRYAHNPQTSFIDGIDGTAHSIASAVIAVFDHPVGYTSVHNLNIYQHFVDTDHAQYESYTISTAPVCQPNNGWIVNTNETNITNLTDLPHVSNLCIFELK